MNNQNLTRFTSLWTQTQSSVLAFIASTVTNFSDAEDILQKVACVAVSKFEQFDSNGDANAFTGWSIQIARFEVLRFLRDKATDRHHYFAEAVDDIAKAFDELAPKIDDRRHALATCFKELKGRPKEVLYRRYGEGLKTGKIAEILGLSTGNVSVILNRGYKTLKQCIETKLHSEARS